MRGNPSRLLPLVAAMLLATATSSLFADQAPGSTPPPPPTPAELGNATSIPTPDEKEVDARKYETSELDGTTAAVGTQLINGRLRKPVLDYGAKSPGSMQRISFFEGGLVVVHMESGGARLRKRVLIPPGAVDEYLKMMPLSDIELLASQSPGTIPPDDRGYIRMYRSSGSPVQVVFSNSTILDARIQRFRTVLDDFVRVLAEDRETTSPLVGYKPKLGDKLVSDDQRLYEVTAIKNEGQYLELTCRQQSTRIYVATDKVYLYFHAVSGGGK